MTRTLAFIGLGAMGLPMARRLVEAQFRVQGFDLNPKALAAHEAQGGVSMLTAAEACAGAEALILMVVNAGQARAALLETGALQALDPDALVILMATCAPADAREIAAMVEASGRRFLDAPVSGGTVGAEAGTLTIMAAGPEAHFAAARPILAALGDKLHHVGERAGDGAMVKTINQLLCGVHIAVAAEAFALAEKAGLDPGLVLGILGQSAAASWMLSNRGPRMLQAEPPVTSAVDIFVKDLSLVLDAGRAAKVALPLAASAHQMFLAASGAGHGLADDSQVIRAYRALNGTD
ncbi:NAD(P)-dependent oxidoreductase [Rhabdaerophilum calidifontis]|uniref:NAD(P)-dependent oxidoreductase n=1 Tax=Rhabdaerophilum calidifontis TaxID=2604328 RepID=UPI00123B0E4A|nr:NAD(P)-dependent oxidoreductase [Rhabdaerophilum calidifontis]